MNLTCRIDAIHLRHGNVHENDVWLQGHGLGDRLDATGHLTHDLESRASSEKLAQTDACYSVIIGDQNTQRLRRPTRGVINQAFPPSRVMAWCFCGVRSETLPTSAR